MGEEGAHLLVNKGQVIPRHVFEALGPKQGHGAIDAPLWSVPRTGQHNCGEAAQWQGLQSRM